MNQQGRIAVIGSANMDIVLRVDRLPNPGETITGGDMALFAGGKGANQACAAGKLGGSVAFIGQVGSDPFGTALLASLSDAGVDIRHAGITARPSGCASIYVLESGENAIVISPGANATLDPETALSRLDRLERVDLILLQLEIPIETVAAALAWARAHGAATILDPAPARPLSPSLLSQVDFLTPNQSEAATLLGTSSREIRGFAAAEQAAGALLALGPASVIVKLGSLGCLVATPQARARVPGFPVAAVDTTGAGDAFNGGLAVALAEKQPLVDAARFANAAGAVAVTRNGAQASLPTREELRRLQPLAAAI